VSLPPGYYGNANQSVVALASRRQFAQRRARIPPLDPNRLVRVDNCWTPLGADRLKRAGPHS